jgi:hypothetical protein
MFLVDLILELKVFVQELQLTQGQVYLYATDIQVRALLGDIFHIMSLIKNND